MSKGKVQIKRKREKEKEREKGIRSQKEGGGEGEEEALVGEENGEAIDILTRIASEKLTEKDVIIHIL